MNRTLQDPRPGRPPTIRAAVANALTTMTDRLARLVMGAPDPDLAVAATPGWSASSATSVPSTTAG